MHSSELEIARDQGENPIQINTQALYAPAQHK